ncbi:hypothetical protein HK104_010885 [Borealophlyctis nickersoniae]|nr:hypothetical protein HK104_010885 [Borealophlyctis nickersoniae]
MATHKALVLPEPGKSVTLETVPTPTPESGQVLVKILATRVPQYGDAYLTGTPPFNWPNPHVPGASAVGRVIAVGPDATVVKEGQLVVVDPVIRARDDQTQERSHIVLLGLIPSWGPAGNKLCEGIWRNGTWAEKALVPLECVFPIDEEVCIKKRRYSPAALSWINPLLVPYGGFCRMNLLPGETIIICFASGHFGRAAVDLALALGAGRVVAVGRNAATLAPLTAKYGTDRVSSAVITGDVATDTKTIRGATPRGEGAECFLDLSPPLPGPDMSKHLKACLQSMKTYGRVAFMGGISDDVTIPYGVIAMRNLTVHGVYMYERDAPAKMIRLIESGRIPLEDMEYETYGLDEWRTALERGRDGGGAARGVVLTPNVE